MSSSTSRRAFQALLVLVGLIAIMGGSARAVFGAGSLTGAESVSATVDNWMRFYAVWYVGIGILLVWAARNLERARALIVGLAGLLFVAALARGLSWLTVGEPHTLAQLLMVIELVLPFVIVPWCAALARSNDVAARVQ